MADRGTVEVYEAHASEYRRRRKAYDPDRAGRFAAAVDGLRLDVGCGPGLYFDLLGRPLVGTDVAFNMCVEARAGDAGGAAVPVLQHELTALPFRPGTFAGVWAWKCLQHVRAAELPLALAELQRAMAVGGRLELALFRSGRGAVEEELSPSDDDFPGRLFTWWEPEPLTLVLEGAGFVVDDMAATDNTIKLVATRARTLPDIVAPGMQLLVSGLNPSLYAADVGVAYGRPGNRFWPAALEAGVVSVDRDPWHALHHHGVGFTDLVKRASVGAAELTAAEYRHGLARLDHLCSLVQPRAVAFCGVTGWRAATGDKKATLGWQERPVGGRPAYVLPNPSGLNAHTNAAAIAAHLRTAADSPPS